MKIEAWKKLRDTVANSEVEFDMSVWGSETPVCGTAACLAGFACIMEGENIAVMNSRKIEKRAAEILGISTMGEYSYCDSVAYHVFMGEWTARIVTLSEITREEALKYLDKVIAEKDPLVGL